MRLLGIEGGGTRTSALLVEGTDTVLASLAVGPGNLRLLGAEIVGKDAGELIHAFTGPLAMKATVFDLLRAPWYHPTLAEIVTYPLEEIADKIKGA